MEEVIDIADLTSDIEFKDTLNNAISTSKHTIPQRESLFLIAKLLQSTKGFENTAATFEKELVFGSYKIFIVYKFTISQFTCYMLGCIW